MGLRATVLLLALLTGFAAACGGSDAAPKKAAVVIPVFGDPCRNDPCAAHGACVPAKGGGPACMCDPGYGGTLCERCDTGFHLDAKNRCVPSKSCADQDPNPCAPHGSCNDSAGVIACDCDLGYAGPRCDLCASGYGHDTHGQCLQVVLGGDGPYEQTDAGGLSEAGAGGTTHLCTGTSCNGRGVCDDADGSIKCSCNVGYASAPCSKCDTGYHRDSLEQCVPDQACAQNSCGGHGSCDASSGLAACTCDAGYAGPSCGVCAPGFHASAALCALDQQCLGTTCASHGTCTESAGQTTCACGAGYASAHCDSCASGYHRDTLGACAANQVCSGTDCGVNGDCVDTTGVIVCACHAGYTGAACASCAPGFHTQGSACALDQMCLPTSCSSHATCDASTGVVTCVCDPGYQGAACGSCLSGYYLDYGTNTCLVFDCKQNPITAPGVVTFEGIAGYPTASNTCVQTSLQNVPPATLTSIAGDGSVWTCAPSSWVQFSSKHVMLEAGTQGMARLQFAGPISKLTFDYGAYSAIAVQFLADGHMAGALSAPLMTKGTQSFTFQTPISVFELLSTSGSTNIVAFDNIAYEPPVCP